VGGTNLASGGGRGKLTYVLDRDGGGASGGGDAEMEARFWEAALGRRGGPAERKKAPRILLSPSAPPVLGCGALDSRRAAA
jgi:hypothetical protein